MFGMKKKNEKPSFFSKLKQGLKKTRHQLTEGIANIVLGKKKIDEVLLEDLETQLLISDVGVAATEEIISDLTKKVARHQLADGEALYNALREDLIKILKPCEQPLTVQRVNDHPLVILMVGINGAGKTTTIGKLAKHFQQEGKKVMLAAGDTFRAAAVEQLQVWGERNNISVIAQPKSRDSASVIYDAMEAAKARGMDVLLADTAGRLHTQQNLLEELKKVKRVMQKINADAPHEVMLVLDATTGQNALNQAKYFHEAIDLTGVAITKLDGTAKGGIVFAVAKTLGVPIRYIGVGEQIDDLRPFDAEAFVDALLTQEHQEN